MINKKFDKLTVRPHKVEIIENEIMVEKPIYWDWVVEKKVEYEMPVYVEKEYDTVIDVP